MNKDHLAKLKEGVDVWNDWRIRSEALPDLSEADLSGADLRMANLSDANLIQANLTKSDLTNANLDRANLKGAHLMQANLTRANIRRANLAIAFLFETNLAGADLKRVDLSGSTLKKANLQVADFRNTNLTGTDLTEADFNGIKFGGTTFGKTLLMDTIGLENSYHFYPSTIDHRTLEISGQLPGVFLRGCGLPDVYIDFLSSLLNQPIQFYSCFISYNHEDKIFARRLHDQLQGKGIRCWLDEHQLLPGDDIHEQVDRGIKLWDKVLLCCSESSLTSWWVDKEINTAFQKEQKLMKERKEKILSLIPLNLDGHLFRWENGKADEVKSRMAADFTGWEKDNDKFEAAFDKIVKALSTDNLGREPAPKSKL